MHIPYVAKNFPVNFGRNLQGSHNLSVSWPDLVWAALTTGKSGFSHLLAHRWHSLADMVVRSHSIYANLRESGGRLAKSPLYEAADPTEKGATSYFLGMVMGKLFAERLLDTPWVFHLSSVSSSVGQSITYKHGRSRPDLIGQNSRGQWVVLEAKGRTGRFCRDAINSAKQQTQMIRQINGVNPCLRAGLLAYFDDGLSVHITDPEDSDPLAVNVTIDMDFVFSSYYAFAYALMKKGVREIPFLGQTYEAYDDTDCGVTIGIERGVLEIIKRGAFGEIGAAAARLAHLKADPNVAAIAYRDGIYIALDSRWSSALMSLDPRDRGR